MPYPNHPGKHAFRSIVEPEGYMAYIRSRGRYPTFAPPRGVILVFQRTLMEHIERNHAHTRGDGVFERMLLLTETDDAVGVVGGFGIGAPVTVVVLEELIAFGVRRFISAGTAGSLQPDLAVGDLIVGGSAIRDEGVSHHYLPPARLAHASPVLTERLTQKLREAGHAPRVGTSWTIDTPYRETVEEARAYQAEGVLAVEMEAAALFAVAEHRGVEMGAMFTVSDSLADFTWRPEFHSDQTLAGLETLYRAAVECLRE